MQATRNTITTRYNRALYIVAYDLPNNRGRDLVLGTQRQACTFTFVGFARGRSRLVINEKITTRAVQHPLVSPTPRELLAYIFYFSNIFGPLSVILFTF